MAESKVPRPSAGRHKTLLMQWAKAMLEIARWEPGGGTWQAGGLGTRVQGLLRGFYPEPPLCRCLAGKRSLP